MGKIRLFITLAFAAFAQNALADYAPSGPLDEISIFKSDHYFQISDAGVSLVPASPYEFNVNFEGDNGTILEGDDPLFTINQTSVYLTSVSQNRVDYEHEVPFSTDAARDSAFPNGYYEVEWLDSFESQQSVGINLGTPQTYSDVFPNTAPVLSNATWSSNAMVLDVSESSHTFSWNSFAPTQSNYVVGLDIEDSSGNSVLTVEFLNNNPGSYTWNNTTDSTDLQAGRLVGDWNSLDSIDPSDTLIASLFFGELTTYDTTDPNVSRIIGGFGNVTEFGLQAIPEPSTYALMGAGALIIAGFIYRRRKKA